MDLVIISRAAALAAGLKRYNTGKPCRRGHVSERFVSAGCIECAKDREREYRKTPRAKEYKRAYSKTPKMRAYMDAYQRAYWAEPENATRMKLHQKKSGKKRKAQRRVLGSKHWASVLFLHARKRAREANIPFDPIAVRKLLANPPKRCPVFKIEFKPGSASDASPTIDRIVADGPGYVSGNIWLICHRANRGKSDLTAAEHAAITKAMRKVGAP